MEKPFEITYEMIYKAILKRLENIGVVLASDSLRRARRQGIRATGAFQDRIKSIIIKEPDSLTLALGSNVSYEPYVLGGKVPSWTPIEPLINWVETKKLSWLDKKSGKELSVEQMAYLIRGSIKKKGIKDRNIFLETIKENVDFIIKNLNSFYSVLGLGN